ncbi:MAG: hypothetical protein ACPLYD_16870, partial [Anaerolineae bacterium]
MKAKIFSIVTVLAVLALLLGGPAMAQVGASRQVAPKSAPADAQQARVSAALRSSPVMFIQNVGQFADGARFQVRGADRTIWLAEDGIWVTVLETPKAGNERPPHQRLSPSGMEQVDAPRKGVAIRLSFVGASPNPRLEPFHPLDTVVSYFIGNDPAQWRTNVPVYAGVRYVDLYPGVDLEITGEAGRWTWRLVCGGADCQSALRGVHLRVEGADAVELLPSPDVGRGAGGEGLLLRTPLGEFTLPLLTVESVGQPSPSGAKGPEVQRTATRTF